MRFSFVFLLFFFGLELTAQETQYSFNRLASIEQSCRWITTDGMDQLYAIEGEHNLQKYDPSGKFLFDFNENNLGAISHVDVTNPMQILVYYEEFMTIIMLDRTLSEIARWDVGDWDLALFQLDALGISNDNNLWIYDIGAFALRKVNAQGETLVVSPELNTLTNDDFAPNFLLETNNQIYLNVPSSGVYIFDNLGNYVKNIAIPDLDNFQIFNNQLFFVEEGLLKAHHLFSFQTFEIPLPKTDTQVEQICIGSERLYLRSEKKVEIFEIRKQRK